WAAVILGLSAIVVILSSILGTDRRFSDAAVAELTSGPLGLLHHYPRRDPQPFVTVLAADNLELLHPRRHPFSLALHGRGNHGEEGVGVGGGAISGEHSRPCWRQIRQAFPHRVLSAITRAA